MRERCPLYPSKRTWIGPNLCVFGRDLPVNGFSVRRIVVPKRRFEIRPRPMPTIETARRDGRPTGRYHLSRSRWWNDLPSFVNTPYRISSVGRWCNAKVPSDVETRLHHVRNTSVARLISVIQFTFDPRLSQPLDYMDSCAPSTKVSLLWRLSIVVRGHRMANNTRWHFGKSSTSV